MTGPARVEFEEPASPLRIVSGILLGPATLVAILVILAATVRFTLPAFDADTSLCEVPSSPVPLTDLDSVFVWMQPRWNPRATLLLAAGVRGREGQGMSVEVPSDSVATVWVQTTDRSGNRSCPSNYVSVNLTVNVPVGPTALPPSAEWFDVAGRRIRPPRRPGVFFVRRGRGFPAHLVVIR